MRKALMLSASMMSMVMVVGCAAKPKPASATAAPAAAATSDPRNKVIVHIVSQHQTITVTSSPNGLLYSLKDPSGRMQIAEATPEKFAELQPQLYRQIQNYIAVHADDAPIPTASADIDAGIPTADRQERVVGPLMKSSDQFKQTADRPFPTAREDVP